jgi:type I restriction enzyme, R subunit
VKTLEGLRRESGSDETKVINLVRSLHQELEEEPAAAPLLRPIAERADRILKGMEERNLTDLAAMDYIAALAKEKEEAVQDAQDSGLSARAFGVYWSLKDDEATTRAGVSAVELAKETDALLARFPNAQVNDDEQRRLRAALYRPLLGLDKQDRGRIVEAVLAILLDGGSDDASL